MVSHSDWESGMSVHGGERDGGWVSQRRGERCWDRPLVPGIIHIKPPLRYHSNTAALYYLQSLKLCWNSPRASGIKGNVWHFYKEDVGNLCFLLRNGCFMTLHYTQGNNDTGWYCTLVPNRYSGGRGMTKKTCTCTSMFSLMLLHTSTPFHLADSFNDHLLIKLRFYI